MQLGFLLDQLLHAVLVIADVMFWIGIVVLALVVCICGAQVKNYKKSGSG